MGQPPDTQSEGCRSVPSLPCLTLVKSGGLRLPYIQGGAFLPCQV